MMPLRVLICDDELMARRRAKRLLAAMPDVQVDAECENADAVRAELAKGEFDVLLLDVQMPKETGLELAASLADPKPFLIFITAHPEHAVSAFDLGAIDYVMKPLEEERLGKAIARARAWVERVERVPTEERASPLLVTPTPDTIAIATRNGMVLFAPNEVTHCTFDGQLATVNAAGKRVLTELSLADLSQKLPHLIRVHRRSLLSLTHVDHLESQLSGGYVAHMKGGGAVEVSRQSARDLRRRLRIG